MINNKSSILKLLGGKEFKRVSEEKKKILKALRANVSLKVSISLSFSQRNPDSYFLIRKKFCVISLQRKIIPGIKVPSQCVEQQVEEVLSDHIKAGADSWLGKEKPYTGHPEAHKESNLP